VGAKFCNECSFVESGQGWSMGLRAQRTKISSAQSTGLHEIIRGGARGSVSACLVREKMKTWRKARRRTSRPGRVCKPWRGRTYEGENGCFGPFVASSVGSGICSQRAAGHVLRCFAARNGPARARVATPSHPLKCVGTLAEQKHEREEEAVKAVAKLYGEMFAGEFECAPSTWPRPVWHLAAAVLRRRSAPHSAAETAPRILQLAALVPGRRRAEPQATATAHLGPPGLSDTPGLCSKRRELGSASPAARQRLTPQGVARAAGDGAADNPQRRPSAAA
jgi:hypothetical protein